MLRKQLTWLGLVLIVAFTAGRVWAQETPEQQKIEELEKKIDELDRRLRAAEAREQIAPPAAPASTTAPASNEVPVPQQIPALQAGSQRPTNAGAAAGTIPADQLSPEGLVTAGPGGFTIQSANGDYLLKIGADLQSDVRTFTGGGSSSLTDQILLRRVRPTISGTLYKYIDYFIRPDFGQGQVVLYDAYVQLNYIRHFSLRAGKFKPPVDLERLQSDDDTTFVERGLPTLLAPSRAIGFQLSGDIVNGRLGYQVGLFNPVPDNSLSDTSPGNGRDYVARIFATPFAPGGENPLSGLGFGLGMQGGSVDGVALPAYKTVGQNTFFTFESGVASAGRRTSWEPQAYYYLGPVGLLAEDAVSEQQFQKAIVRKDIALRSWTVEVSYILTGEKKSFGGPIPRHPFSPYNHGWGAWEIAARTGDFSIDNTMFAYGFASLATSPRFAREWVGGVNWYLNRVVRISADYGLTSFLGGAADDANRAAERVILARLQLNFI